MVLLIESSEMERELGAPTPAELAAAEKRVAAAIARHEDGDHRRDFHANRLISRCSVVPIGEPLARHAAALRTRAGRSGVSAIDGMVAATADHVGGAIVLTAGPDDLAALSGGTIHPVTVEGT